MKLQLLGWGLADGKARLQATPGARAVTLIEAMRLKAHMLAWQARRGARHNVTFREPARARRSTGLRHQAHPVRDWCNFADCRVMVKRARSGRFTPQGLCLCVVPYWLTAKRGGKRRRLEGAGARVAHLARITAWLLVSAQRLAVPRSG